MKEVATGYPLVTITDFTTRAYEPNSS